jgi:hypothetical protein
MNSYGQVKRKLYEDNGKPKIPKRKRTSDKNTQETRRETVEK